MALPKAIVTVDIRKIASVGSVIAGAAKPYAIARVSGRFIGRSRLIPSGATDFELTSEPSPWRHEYATVGEAVTVDVEIWDDRGDLAPMRLTHLAASIAEPWPSGPLIFGGAPKIECQVTTSAVPKLAPKIPVPRSAKGAKAGAVLAVPNSAVVELLDITGLYKPVATGKAGLKRAEAVPFYCSEDDLGRIYLNTGLDGKWAKNTQLIQLSARVKVMRGVLPKGTKLKWKLVDPDDPFNDQTDVHQQWGPYIDAGDYSGAAQAGAKGGDNEGKPDHSPAWEQVSAFTLSGPSATEATTEIVGGQSQVKLHCPNVAGDNLIVRAELVPPAKAKLQSFAAQSGIMTMWHRVDVEPVRMSSGFALPVTEVPPMFEQACVQLDFAPERAVPDQQFLAADDDHIETESAKYVEKVFSHKGDPGWFCLVSAMEPYPLPKKKGAKLYEGMATLGDGMLGGTHAGFVDVPASLSDVDYVEFEWGSESVGFSKWKVEKVSAGKVTRIWLLPHDVQDRFTAGDGSIDHAYATSLDFWPTGKLDGGTWSPPGYGIPKSCKVIVSSPGAFYVAGISPTVAKGGVEYFAGRTVMFTHHGHYRDPKSGGPRKNFDHEALTVIAHELVHAFGMPHKCGYYDHRTPREKTCYMNYGPNWMIDSKRELIPGSSEKVGPNLCGRHLKEVRRVHLEDNGGLGW